MSTPSPGGPAACPRTSALAWVAVFATAIAIESGMLLAPDAAEAVRGAIDAVRSLGP